MHSEQAKKRRRILAEPEGFLPTKKPQQRSHVPNFQSAFDKLASSSTTATSCRKLVSMPSRLQQLPIPQLKASVPERKQPVQMQRQPIPHDPRPVKPPIPMKRPEPPTIPNPQRNTHLSKATKPLPPPQAFINEQMSSVTVPLKPLHVPELPTTVHAREMKPLSTTHLAPLSDTSSNDDSVELSSILLRLQDHRLGTESGRDQKPDVLMSPQKNKHVRGGLAARASRIYNKSHTSLYLWRTSMESARQSASSDLSFRVCKILHTVSSGSRKPCLSITLCRILVPVRPFSSRKSLVYVVIKFPDTSKAASSCNPADLREGCSLCIWQPWHQVPLVESASSFTDAVPSASLPLPSSNDSVNIAPDDTIHNTVLLCSRFSICRNT